MKTNKTKPLILNYIEFNNRAKNEIIHKIREVHYYKSIANHVLPFHKDITRFI